MGRMLSAYNNVVSRIVAHYAGERKEGINRRRELIRKSRRI
jgi:hypothetical protein